MSITQQKHDLRAIIHRKVEAYLTEHPDRAIDVAMGAVRRLSVTMTLRELRQWHSALFLSQDWSEEEASSGEGRGREDSDEA